MRQMGNHQAFWLACKFLILKQPLVFPELDAHHCHLDFKLLEKQKRNYAKYILSPAIK